ncbi:MAG: response regulator transcription factor [Ardenticatenaceae bacterium]|nr:response regulator transcription factor [Anaerolineales bacterium]MCB8920063.1 response regulator transcription factor [Ardenticatenaceae bacterium]MCB8989908.1 response regulator transcription factor [Ardenticatenaceae bacterium]
MVTQRILVVDDDREVVRLMRAYLEQAGYEVLVAYEGETAVHTLRREKPDLILLDLMLPGMDGWQITRLMRSDTALAAIPIIMLTARVEDTDKIVGLEMGADDYVTKPYNPREVVARVRARLRAPGVQEPQMLRAGELEMDLGRREVRVKGDLADLTPTEFNLLRVLMEQAGYVFTRAELIRKGLGTDYEGLERTLDSHMRNLRRKIEPDPRDPTYIQTVYGVGYRLEIRK